jgi:TonB family protein
MTQEKKNKIIGAATSGGVHMLILLLVFLLLASAPPIELKEEEPGGGGGGNPIGEGVGSAEGEVGGAIVPVEIAFAPMPESYVGADISAPTISESKTPVDNQTKPSTEQTQTAQTKPQPSALDNMLDQLNGGGGSDASTGGGPGGTGGGNDGGDGGLNGPGKGNFPGFGQGSGWALGGRDMNSPPVTNKKPTANGTVVVSIMVDKNGKVTSANVANSNITTDVVFNHGLAIEAAKKCTFTSSKSTKPQTGTITIVLSVK